MKTTILTILALVLTASTFAQSPATKTSDISRAANAANVAVSTDADDKKGDKISLALTDAEKLDLDTLANRFNQVNAELQARLQVMLDIGCADCNEAFAVKLSVDDARKFYRDTVKPALMAHSARLAEIQKAHDCLGCALKDGEFVKAEGKK